MKIQKTIIKFANNAIAQEVHVEKASGLPAKFSVPKIQVHKVNVPNMKVKYGNV